MILEYLKNLNVWEATDFDKISTHLQQNPSDIPEEVQSIINAGLNKIGTQEYFLNQPEYQQKLKADRTKFAGEVHGSYKDFMHHTLKSEFGDIFSEADLQRIIHDKNVKSKEAMKTVFDTFKQAYETQIQQIKTEAAKNSMTPEEARAFQTSLEEKESALTNLTSQIETMKTNHANEMKGLHRQYEETNILSAITSWTAKQNLANKNQLPAAVEMLRQAIFGNYYPKIIDNKLQAYNRENPEILANDPQTKTTLDLDKYMLGVLDKYSFLAANRGGGGEDTRITNQPGDTNGVFTLPSDVDPNSEYAKNLQNMMNWETPGRITNG